MVFNWPDQIGASTDGLPVSSRHVPLPTDQQALSPVEPRRMVPFKEDRSMSADMNTTVREIRVSAQPDSSYFLQVEWEGRSLGAGFQVLLTDGRKAWTGGVSEAGVRSEAEELEMQTECYVHDLQEALTGSTGSAPYSFMLTWQRDAGVVLTYEKKKKDISFRLGSVLLSVVSEASEAVKNLLRQNLKRGNELQLQKQKLQQEELKLRAEQQQAARLKRYSSVRKTLEADLFSRFIFVLNQKKTRVRILQETCDQLENRRDNDSFKSDEDEYGGSTDEEQPCSTFDLPAPETPPPAIPLDNSLSDITDVAPNRKRRYRQLEAPRTVITPGGHQGASHIHSVSPAGGSTEAAAPSSAENLFDDF